MTTIRAPACLLLVLAACRSAPPAPPEAPAEPPWEPSAFRVDVAGSGPPIVLIPGLTCSGHVWDETVRRWSGTHELHVLTLAGFAGQTPIEPPLLDAVHRDLVRYLHERRLDRPAVIGHSLGGLVAFRLAAAEPDLIGSVVIVDSVPFLSGLFFGVDSVDAARARAETLRDSMAAQSPEEFAAQTRAMLAGMITNPEEVDRVARESALSSPTAVAEAMYELLTTDLRAEVGAVRSPTLVLAACGDAPGDPREVVELYRAQSAAIPGLRVVAAERARHFIMLDDPEWFHRTVEEFLEEARGRADSP